jgi:hypothetical protein
MKKYATFLSETRAGGKWPALPPGQFHPQGNTPTPKSNIILNGRKVDLHVVAKKKIHVPVAY